MLVDFQNVGGFPKCWRMSKMLADLQNVGAFQNIGGCTKFWRLAETQADDRILVGVEISVPGEISVDLEKVGDPLTVQARQNLQLMTSSWTG